MPTIKYIEYCPAGLTGDISFEIESNPQNPKEPIRRPAVTKYCICQRGGESIPKEDGTLINPHSSAIRRAH